MSPTPVPRCYPIRWFIQFGGFWTERSPDGVVTVTVDKDGLLTGLTFSGRAQGLAPAALSCAVLACVHTARGRIGAHIERAVRETGVDEETAAHFIADYRSRHPRKFSDEEFAMPVENPQPMAVRRSSRPAPDEDGDDFGDGFSVLRHGYGTSR